MPTTFTYKTALVVDRSVPFPIYPKHLQQYLIWGPAPSEKGKATLARLSKKGPDTIWFICIVSLPPTSYSFLPIR
jgi:hypothetical protein